MINRLKKISSEIVASNPWWVYRQDKYELPNGSVGDYHYVDSRGATMVIPRLDNGNFVMTRQFRYLNDKISLEFPGGGIKPGLEPRENAVRELIEETSYEPATMELIGFYNPYNGVTNELCHIYFAESLTPSKALDPDETEEFEIISLSQDEIISKISSNEIWDGMTLAAWSLYYFSQLNRNQK